jgi:hypothetical protein
VVAHCSQEDTTSLPRSAHSEGSVVSFAVRKSRQSPEQFPPSLAPDYASIMLPDLPIQIQ